ncbi:MAG: anion transporter [Planctomycetota bacterium]|nr:MAG: anion transporter [Planctomycetota bacterium]
MSQLEQRLELFRRRIGLVLAPLLFVFILSADFESLTDKPTAHRLAAVMAAVVVLWVTEAIPMPLTALLGATACVILQVAPAKNVFAPYADQLMFLFIGSFMLARAIELHGLDRRLALSVLTLRAVGGSPSRVLFAFGATTAFISAWISNTATTAMMFAIGLSILKVLRDEGGSRNSEGGMQDGSVVPTSEFRPPNSPQIDPRYATGLMLMTSFSASIGGLATPIGTPPNVIGLNFIRKLVTRDGTPIDVTFFEWCLIGVPIVVVLYLFMFAYLNWFCPSGVRELAGGREYLAQQRRALGPWTRGQLSTLVAFVVMVVLWVAPGVIANQRRLQVVQVESSGSGPRVARSRPAVPAAGRARTPRVDVAGSDANRLGCCSALRRRIRVRHVGSRDRAGGHHRQEHDHLAAERGKFWIPDRRDVRGNAGLGGHLEHGLGQHRGARGHHDGDRRGS